MSAPLRLTAHQLRNLAALPRHRRHRPPGIDAMRELRASAEAAGVTVARALASLRRRQ